MQQRTQWENRRRRLVLISIKRSHFITIAQVNQSGTELKPVRLQLVLIPLKCPKRKEQFDILPCCSDMILYWDTVSTVPVQGDRLKERKFPSKHQQERARDYFSCEHGCSADGSEGCCFFFIPKYCTLSTIEGRPTCSILWGKVCYYYYYYYYKSYYWSYYFGK